MYSKTEKRFFKRYFPNGSSTTIPVEYTLWFDKATNKLVEVRNEAMVVVEKNSECWEFFDNKYNHL